MLTLFIICSFSDIYILIFIVSGWGFFVIIGSIYHNLFNCIIYIEWIKNTFIASWIIMLLLLTLFYICSFSDIYILIFIVSGWVFLSLSVVSIIIFSTVHIYLNKEHFYCFLNNNATIVNIIFYLFSDIYILIFIVLSVVSIIIFSTISYILNK